MLDHWLIVTTPDPIWRALCKQSFMSSTPSPERAVLDAILLALSRDCQLQVGDLIFLQHQEWAQVDHSVLVLSAQTCACHRSPLTHRCPQQNSQRIITNSAVCLTSLRGGPYFNSKACQWSGSNGEVEAFSAIWRTTDRARVMRQALALYSWPRHCCCFARLLKTMPPQPPWYASTHGLAFERRTAARKRTRLAYLW